MLKPELFLPIASNFSSRFPRLRILDLGSCHFDEGVLDALLALPDLCQIVNMRHTSGVRYLLQLETGEKIAQRLMLSTRITSLTFLEDAWARLESDAPHIVCSDALGRIRYSAYDSSMVVSETAAQKLTQEWCHLKHIQVPYLKSCSMWDFQFTAAAAAVIALLRPVEFTVYDLDFSYTPLGIAMAALEQLDVRRLTCLKLADKQFWARGKGQEVYRALARLTNLVDLELQGTTSFRDQGISQLNALLCLAALQLKSYRITHDGLSQLTRLTMVARLDIEFCMIESRQQHEDIFALFPRLDDLGIGSYGRFDCGWLEDCIARLTALKLYNYSGRSGLEELGNLCQLQSLHLPYFPLARLQEFSGADSDH